MLHATLALLFGYLAGSIPSGVIVTRLAGADDPRAIGSKNIGATNVLRTGRKDLAALTRIADALKGPLPGRSEGAVLFAALAIVLWLKHRTNIARLLDGTESRIGRKKTVPAA